MSYGDKEKKEERIERVFDDSAVTVLPGQDEEKEKRQIEKKGQQHNTHRQDAAAAAAAVRKERDGANDYEVHL